MKKKCIKSIMVLLLLTGCMKMQHTPSDPLELVFANETYQLTGVAVTDDGRQFTNYPFWSDTYRFAVTEIGQSYQETPYPDMNRNNWSAGQDGMLKWVCVQSVVSDNKKFLWVVDPASPKMQGVYNSSNKLVKIDPATNTVIRTYPVSMAAGAGSYINDVRIDTENNYAYMTNSQEGGIVVVDLSTGSARQVLQNHYSVRSDPAYTFIIDGKELKKNGQVVKIHSDGIALTPNGEWLYYKPLTDDKLYRIKTSYLRDATMTNTALGSKVEDLGHFTATDGMIFDSEGNLYLGDMQNYRIMKITPDHKMTELIRDERLVWPDSYSISQGWLYISCSHIHKQPEYNEGINKRTRPYSIYRLKI
jgi:sugar lactone lactonase YvrE